MFQPGRMGDEFDQARADRFNSLADALSPGRIVLQLQAGTVSEAIPNIFARIPRRELPGDPPIVSRALLHSGQLLPPYVGKGLVIRHTQLEGVDQPVLVFARSDQGVALEGTHDRADLIFLLLTSPTMARIRTRLLADIVDLFDSEYVAERLRKAEAPNAVIEAIRAGQAVASTNAPWSVRA